MVNSRARAGPAGANGQPGANDYFAEAQNFKLMETAEQELSEERWSVLVPHSDEVLLGAFELFDDYLVLQERREGLVHLHVRPWAGDGAHHVAFDEPVFDSYIGVNREPDTQVLRFGYESLPTPTSPYDLSLIHI